jgi:putative aldouronate transport system substrate-binding protein
MKRVLIIAVALCFCVSVMLTGCGQGTGTNDSNKTSNTTTQQKSNSTEAVSAGDSNVNPAGQLPIVKDKITLSAFVVQNALINDFDNNEATIELEKRTNIHLDFVAVPEVSIAEKKQLLLASGDYPDIFLTGEFTNEEIMQYGYQQKIFVPLNSLIDKYGTEIKKTYDAIAGFKGDITAPDGNIYGIPQINECYHCWYSQKMWIDNTWLEKLSLKIPETTEDFYQVLKAFKTKDPNGNKKQDEIPLTGCIKTWHAEPQHFLMNAFVYDDGDTYFKVENDKLSFVANTPEWKEGLKYINKLYSEGLIDPSSFTQSLDQLEQVGNIAGDNLLGCVAAGHVAMFTKMDDTATRHREYTVVPPLEGPNGVRTTPCYRDITGAYFTITDKCKYPEAALRLCDYFYSNDGTILMDWGPEGTTWEKAQSGDKDIVGNSAKRRWIQFTTHGDVQNYHWNQNGPTKRDVQYNNEWAVDQDIYKSASYVKRLQDLSSEYYAPYAPKEWFTAVFLPADQINEISQLKTNIKDYVNQSMVQFITGSMNIDKDWDNYVNKLKDLQIDKYIKIYDDAYETKMKNN